MTVTVRFAPSPTGHIHIGNARPALMNWLFARARGGRFILRFDDTDALRSRAEYADAILNDLAWLGIAPDRIERQSERLDRYEAAAEALKARGLLYACYETAEELEYKRRRRRAQGLPPIYDRAGYRLSQDDRSRLEAEGRTPHWRFLLPNFDADPMAPGHRTVGWQDLARGPQTSDLGSLSDPVLIRADGTYLYTLPSVVDDIDMGVSHVIRGDDHVTNTAVQLALFEALGAAAPAFGHHNLLVTADGEGFSKRAGSLSLAALREAGFEPAAVATMAVRLGTSQDVAPLATLDALAEGFDIAHCSRSPARFDETELRALNARLLASLPHQAVAERLADLGVGGGAAFWDAVRHNIAVLSEAAVWWRVVEGPVERVPRPEEERTFLAAAATLLPDEPWDGATWSAWTGAIKARTGRKGRALFMPLRLALTGRDHGPELAGLLPLIGRTETLARLA